jgi:hypothetical protein
LLTHFHRCLHNLKLLVFIIFFWTRHTNAVILKQSAMAITITESSATLLHFDFRTFEVFITTSIIFTTNLQSQYEAMYRSLAALLLATDRFHAFWINCFYLHSSSQ